MTRAVSRAAVTAGVLLVWAHVMVLPGLLRRAARPGLEVRPRDGERVVAPAASVVPAADLPAALRDRVTVTVDGRAPPAGAPAPGLRRVEWRVGYRGGFSREVSLTRLAGPFQDPAAPPCGVRLRVGQAILDDGRAGPGTVAGLAAAAVDAGVRGVPMDWRALAVLGRYRGVASAAAWWSDEVDVGVAAQCDPVPGGALRGRLALAFDKGQVEVEVTLAPRLDAGRLRLEGCADARVAMGDRWRQWVVDAFEGSDRATGIARDEIDGVLGAILLAPPAIGLGGGRTLPLAPCAAEPVRIVERDAAILAFSVAPAPAGEAPGPVRLPTAGAPAPPSAAPLALELDLDAWNAVLAHLHAAGRLDRLLEERGVREAFNGNPVVTELLTVRVRGLALALPPVVERAPAGAGAGAALALGAEARLVLDDAGRRVPASLFARVGLAVERRQAGVGLALPLLDLGLTCEPVEGVLEPCYSDVIDELRRRADAVLEPLADEITRTLDEAARDRELGPDGSPTRFRIGGLRSSAWPDGASGWIRLEIDGTLVGR